MPGGFAMRWSIARVPMTMPSEPLAGGLERRLHPLSWLFVLLASLREFAVPLLAALVFGSRSESPWELIGLIGGGLLAVNAVVAYFSYRFRIDHDELMIRSGVFQRQLRHIPFRRIHNVTVHQNLLHRLLGVAEVKLESAGGVKPEAHMRVLRLSDAQALEALVRRRGASADSSQPEPAGSPPLLALDTAELVRLGLISNRGMVLVAAIVGLLAQSGSNVFSNLVERASAPVIGWFESAEMGLLSWIVGGLLVFLMLAAALRLLSVLLAIARFHGFTLQQEEDRLRVDAGLLTRIRANAPLRRIQAWHRHESLLHRWFGRQSLSVDTATTVAADQTNALRELVPLATAERIDGLLAGWLPDADWQRRQWRPIHPRAWRRMLKLPVFLTLAASVTLSLRVGPMAFWLLLLLPWWLLRARKLADCLRYSVDPHLVAIRSGWLGRHWRFAEIAKLQGLRLTRSPFDRRTGMATLWLDTAGASGNPMAPTLRIPYLPEAEARRLLTDLSERIAATRLKW
jgi:putative membrane protein